MSLTAPQRRYLKSLAHHLDPTVRIGRAGVSAPQIKETNRALEAHELIKVRIDSDDAGERGRLAESLAAETRADVVGSIGKVAMLFRARTEKPKIKLPKGDGGHQS